MWLWTSIYWLKLSSLTMEARTTVSSLASSPGVTPYVACCSRLLCFGGSFVHKKVADNTWPFIKVDDPRLSTRRSLEQLPPQTHFYILPYISLCMWKHIHLVLAASQHFLRFPRCLSQGASAQENVTTIFSLHIICGKVRTISWMFIQWLKRQLIFQEKILKLENK